MKKPINSKDITVHLEFSDQVTEEDQTAMEELKDLFVQIAYQSIKHD